jgi:predicted 2-oxoglutarate/Fe(II)-dependent dioxygenase YbiX
MDFYTLPSTEDLELLQKAAPIWMNPNKQPYAVVAPGYFSEEQCENIVEKGMQEEPYKQNGCGAETRELPGAAFLQDLDLFARTANNIFWGLELHDEYVGWLQTYDVGGNYQTHMDSAPGQARKLTAVLMLTDDNAYLGGDLMIHPPPFQWQVPKKQGTVVVFLPYLLHTVTPVTYGVRQTINMGFWGPPFK